MSEAEAAEAAAERGMGSGTFGRRSLALIRPRRPGTGSCDICLSVAFRSPDWTTKAHYSESWFGAAEPKPRAASQLQAVVRCRVLSLPLGRRPGA